MAGSIARAEGGLAERLGTILGQERRSLGIVPAERLVALIDPAAAAGIVAAAPGAELAAAPAVATADPAGTVPEVGIPLGVAVARAPRGAGAEWECLTEALYFEARSESLRGVLAVAEVILNRVGRPGYPGSVCGVVRQGGEGLHDCQFSYRCDGRAEVVQEDDIWEVIGQVASYMLNDAPRSLTDGATHYHTLAVQPFWAERFQRTATIGFHHFYREPLRTASN